MQKVGNMKQKMRFAAILCTFHIVASTVLWGCLLVYQRGYNTMHREEIPVASIRTAEQHTQVQILEESYSFPTAWLGEESPLYFAAHALTGEPLHFWMQLLGSFVNEM